MKLEHITTAKAGEIKAYDEANDRYMGYISYTLDDGKLLLEHTVVNPEYRGQGIAEKLVEECVSLCRSKGWKLVPICSYAVKLIGRKETWSDVL